MNRNEIMRKLKELLEDTVGGSWELTDELRLMEDLGLSSVDMLYLIIATEETFGIRFENIGIRDVQTVGAVADYIEAHLP
jgi:acyl carrier protein